MIIGETTHGLTFVIVIGILMLMIIFRLICTLLKGRYRRLYQYVFLYLVEKDIEPKKFWIIISFHILILLMLSIIFIIELIKLF
ncbi:MAG: hypothetical protein Q8L27_00260 [archaeon]|nr:hypothetical protein [archaeon]